MTIGVWTKPWSVSHFCVYYLGLRSIANQAAKAFKKLTYRYQEEISTLETLRRSENVPDSEFKLKNSLEVHNISRRCPTKILSPENKSQIFVATVATELITQVADAVVQVSAIEYIISNVYALRIYDSKQKLTERKSLIFQN